jgi:hypothetical protein
MASTQLLRSVFTQEVLIVQPVQLQPCKRPSETKGRRNAGLSYFAMQWLLYSLLCATNCWASSSAITARSALFV